MGVEIVSIKRRNLASQGLVLKYLWSGSYRSVLGCINSKQALFGVILESVSWNNNFSVMDRFSC